MIDNYLCRRVWLRWWWKIFRKKRCTHQVVEQTIIVAIDKWPIVLLLHKRPVGITWLILPCAQLFILLPWFSVAWMIGPLSMIFIHWAVVQHLVETQRVLAVQGLIARMISTRRRSCGIRGWQWDSYSWKKNQQLVLWNIFHARKR